MNAFNKFLSSAALSAAILTSAVAGGYTAGIVNAEEEYLARDPFYNYSSEYNYYESEHFQFI